MIDGAVRSGVPDVTCEALERIAASIADRFGLANTHGAARRLGAHAELRRRALDLAAVDTYAARVLRSDEELWQLACAVSNGWTWFLRDEEQLVGLADRLAARRTSGPTWLWVAGCSSGEEAYGLAMLCMERGLDVRIAATDIDEGRLEAARRGVYGAWSVRNISSAMRDRWLEPVAPDAWRVREVVRSVVQIRRHNLMDTPPWTARFDAVSCRNVLIYCTQPAVAQILSNLSGALAPGGELVLGASDALPAQLVPPAPRRNSTLPPMAPRAGLEPPARTIPHALEPPSSSADELAPLLTTGHLLVGACAFDRAEQVYRRASELDPCSAELHLAWGMLHRKRGDWERAVSSLRQTIFLDPGVWQAWALLAGCLARLGRLTESQRALHQARAARRARPATPWRSLMDGLLTPDDELLLTESDARIP